MLGMVQGERINMGREAWESSAGQVHTLLTLGMAPCCLGFWAARREESTYPERPQRAKSARGSCQSPPSSSSGRHFLEPTRCRFLELASHLHPNPAAATQAAPSTYTLLWEEGQVWPVSTSLRADCGSVLQAGNCGWSCKAAWPRLCPASWPAACTPGAWESFRSGPWLWYILRIKEGADSSSCINIHC